MYYPHNLHFLAWSAMFLGRSAAAYQAALDVVENIPDFSKPEEWSASESFRSQAMVVLVRFGRWDELLAYPQPNGSDLYLTGIWHYGRGLAYLHQAKDEQAKTELSGLAKVLDSLKQHSGYRVGFASADSLLNISMEILSGEIAAKHGDAIVALAHLEKAVRIEDGLQYSEPPSWYFPVRHILGAVLLDIGLPAEAEVVYWDDLRKNPENGYSLFGLKQSLEAQHKTDIAQTIGKRFDEAWAHADVSLSSSRY